MGSTEKNMNLMITVDDGSRRVPVCNKEGEEIGAFTFRPTDIGIVTRYNHLADTFDSVTEPLEGIANDETGEVDIFDPRNAAALQEATERLYAAVNELLGSDSAAAAFFGTMNPFSPVEGGLYCAQVLSAVGKFIGAQFDAQTKQLSKKAKKYLK